MCTKKNIHIEQKQHVSNINVLTIYLWRLNEDETLVLRVLRDNYIL